MISDMGNQLFSFPKSPDNVQEPPNLLPNRYSGREEIWTILPHLVPRLRMLGAITFLPHMPTQRARGLHL